MTGTLRAPVSAGRRASARARAEAAAEATAMSRLLAIYLRESGRGAPEAGRRPGGRRWARVPLPGADAAILGVPASASLAGHHRVEPPLWLVTASGPPRLLCRAAEVAALVATELLSSPPVVSGLPLPEHAGGGGSAGETHAGHAGGASGVGAAPPDGSPDGSPDRPPGGGPPDSVPDRVAAVVRTVEASVSRSAGYRHRRMARAWRPTDVLDAADQNLAAEQSLVTGHPFHPAPKAAEGFDLDDVERYAPEAGASFPLWWFAAPPEAMWEEQVPGVTPPSLPPGVAAAARARLGSERSGWRLLPCHPWQARRVAERADVAAALDQGLVRLLGPLGPAVHPTSSVRTVRLPGGDYWKLSLGVRVTNFVRHNTPEEVRRTLDAGRLVASLPRATRTPGFEVLAESGARALAPGAAPRVSGERGRPWPWPPGPPACTAATAPAATAAPAEPAPAATAGTGISSPGAALCGTTPTGDLVTATTVLHRTAPGPGPTPLVVAALLEPDPVTGVTPVARLLGRAARSTGVAPARMAPAWVRAYLAVTLRPLLRLLVDEGIGLEAHPQNSLVGFTAGWPRRLVVRDLEGTSIDREHPRAARHRRILDRDESPVLYRPEEAWQRFAYHVVVNHVGHLVATVAAEAGIPEDALWQEVAAAVVAEATRAPGPVAERLRAALLGPHLPAKANLVSLLAGQAEHPAYVAIPNPCRAVAT